jgi:hypothetical protein
MDLQKILPVLEEVTDYLSNAPKSAYEEMSFAPVEVTYTMGCLLKSMQCSILKINSHGWSDIENYLLKILFVYHFNPKEKDKFYRTTGELFNCKPSAIERQLLHLNYITKPFRIRHAKEKIISGKDILNNRYSYST